MNLLNATRQKLFGACIQAKLFGLFCVVGCLGIAGSVWFLCRFSNQTAFLPRKSAAHWIIYPKPPSGQIQAWTDLDRAPDLKAVFRRAFTVTHVPSRLTLKTKGFRNLSVWINGEALPGPGNGQNWKQGATADIARYVVAGQNTIRVEVKNRGGPPALWLNIAGNNCELSSDRSWQVSYEGAVWLPAALASDTPQIAKGNPLYGGETIGDAIRFRWKTLAVFLFCAALLVSVVRYCSSLRKRQGIISSRINTALTGRLSLALLVLLWTVLSIHNARLLPPNAGFDHDGHIEYITYVQQNCSLPSPSLGWETFQQPLYYVISAAILNLIHLGANTFDGVVALRLFSLGVSALHLWCIFGVLQLLFPRETGKQALGLAVAGLLPMHLYLAHYVTNEILAACLMSATLLLIMKVLIGKGASLYCYLALGLCFGLAILTKATAAILGPFYVAALIHGWRKQQPRASRWTFPLLSILVACACFGWRSWQIWRQCGHSLFPTPQSPYGVSYFQDPGYRTLEHFTRFGRSLSEPFYSGLFSFWDGVYSTIFGDGLWGGACVMGYRPPWDYNFMAIGYLLALVPAALMLTGLVSVLIKNLRKPEPKWILLLSFSFCLAFALFLWNLTFTTYAVARGFYCLSGLAGLAVFSIVGWESWATRFKPLRGLAALMLLVWAMNSYVSFWVREASPTTQAALAEHYLKSKDIKATAACLEKAFRSNPSSPEASACLFSLMAQQGRASEAAEFAASRVRLYPKDSAWHLKLAAALEAKGLVADSLKETRKAVALGPDSPGAHMDLATRLWKAEQFTACIAASREALRILPAEQGPHLLLASALLARAAEPGPIPENLLRADFTVVRSNASAKERLVVEGIEHLRSVISFSPTNAAALERLSWVLATSEISQIRDGKEAVRLAKQGCKAAGFRDPAMLLCLAAAYAEAGAKEDAMEILREAEPLLQTSGDDVFRERYRALAKSIPLGRGYR